MSRRVFAMLGLLVAGLGAAHGDTWNEADNGDGDAGALPATAQAVDNGTNAELTTIVGTLSAGIVDRVDMYAIRVDDPALFLASTTSNTSIDTKLFLFDDAGRGLLANEDFNGSTFQSQLQPPATDGTGQAIPGVGLYYLAITNSEADPVNDDGSIFDIADFTEVSGPDGAGGASPITGWSTFANELGAYQIDLRGATFIPEPAGLLLLPLAVVALIRRR